jgi:ribA/ribD-fused uncharacterized protein
MIKQFSKENRWLSNFSPATIIHEGITYPSVEHFYVAMKSADKGIREQIAALDTAGQAKRVGREIEKTTGLPKDWHTEKLVHMRFALEQKYNQGPYKQQLIDTGGQTIIEGNTWGDEFWGVNLKTDEGENNLGIMIMEIRENLK